MSLVKDAKVWQDKTCGCVASQEVRYLSLFCQFSMPVQQTSFLKDTHDINTIMPGGSPRLLPYPHATAHCQDGPTTRSTTQSRSDLSLTVVVVWGWSYTGFGVASSILFESEGGSRGSPKMKGAWLEVQRVNIGLKTCSLLSQRQRRRRKQQHYQDKN